MTERGNGPKRYDLNVPGRFTLGKHLDRFFSIAEVENYFAYPG